MTQDFTLWKHQVSRAIGRLCDIEFQASGCFVGQERNGAGLREALSSLYVESQFGQFLSFGAWRQAGLDEATGQELDALRRQLDAYDEPDSDAAILADPNWEAIVVRVKKVLLLLN